MRRTKYEFEKFWFEPGETIRIKAEIDNSESSHDVNFVQIELRREIEAINL